MHLLHCSIHVSSAWRRPSHDTTFSASVIAILSSSRDSNFLSRRLFLTFGNRNKSHIAKSGLYGGCGSATILKLRIVSFTRWLVCTGALSWWNKNPDLASSGRLSPIALLSGTRSTFEYYSPLRVFYVGTIWFSIIPLLLQNIDITFPALFPLFYGNISGATRVIFRCLSAVTEPTKPLINCTSGKCRLLINSPQILLYVIWSFLQIYVEINYFT